MITVVLVNPQGDANIGATARAMKNFGVIDLRLISPCPHLTKPAYMWAVEAKDVLESAKVFQNLDDALADVSCSVAFSRRTGKLRRETMNIDEAGGWLNKKAKKGGLALVFGREDSGLSSDETGRCDAIITIPSSKKLPSLNLAQSVLIACHEIFKCKNEGAEDSTKQKFASKKEIRPVLNRLGVMLKMLDYKDEDPDHLRSKILDHFEKLFGRGGLTPRDLKMFEGLTSRIIEKCT